LLQIPEGVQEAPGGCRQIPEDVKRLREDVGESPESSKTFLDASLESP
jgi:hypothetical protein